MIVEAKVYIKYNGERYCPGEEFEIEERHFEGIKDIVEIIDDSNPDNEEDDPSHEEDELMDLPSFSVAKLRSMAKERGIKGYSNMEKEELLEVL